MKNTDLIYLKLLCGKRRGKRQSVAAVVLAPPAHTKPDQHDPAHGQRYNAITGNINPILIRAGPAKARLALTLGFFSPP